MNLKNYSYILTVGKARERRFPDTEFEFIMRNTAFLDPSIRKLQKSDMQALAEKFHTRSDPFL